MTFDSKEQNTAVDLNVISKRGFFTFIPYIYQRKKSMLKIVAHLVNRLTHLTICYSIYSYGKVENKAGLPLTC